MDDFIPVTPKQGELSAMPSIVGDSNADLKANMELARAASDAQFLLIVGKQMSWQAARTTTPAVITTDEEYAQAVVVRKDMDSALKILEEVRLSYVAFPTRVIDMINGLFRQTRRSIEENRDWLRRLVAKRDHEKEQTRQKELEEARRLNEEQMAATQATAQSQAVGISVGPVVSGGMTSVVFVDPEMQGPIEPENSVSSTKMAIAANVHDFDVTVTDKVEFMKLLVSKAATQIWITEHAAELVTVDVERLKQLLRENPGKRKVAGCEIVRSRG